MFVCIWTDEDVSECKRWFWGFEWAKSKSSTGHVLNPCLCADGSYVLMQPSGLSDTEWHHVLFPDLCVKREMERWVERKRYVEGKQKVREGTKTRTTLIIAGLPEEENDGRRIRGWWRAEEALKDGGICAELSDGKDGRGLHVRIIGSFYTRSK